MNRVLLFALFAALLVTGCASIGGSKSEVGNPIDKSKVSQIMNGKTTATEILGLFGAPSMTTTLGGNEIFSYKNCRTGGTGVGLNLLVASVGTTGSKERCNTLSVTIDKTTGVVQNYNFQQMFETD